MEIGFLSMESSESEEEVTVSGLPPFLILEYPDGDFLGRRDKCSFILIPPDEQELEHMILENGGQILVSDEDIKAEKEYAVTILCERFFLQNPQKDSTLPLDTFSSVYIYDSIQNSKRGLALPNLNDFRLTPSKFQRHKPEDILWKRKKWSDLVQLSKPPKKRTTAQEIVGQLKACWSEAATEAEKLNNGTQESCANDTDESTPVNVALSVKPSEPQESWVNDAKESSPVNVAPSENPSKPQESSANCTKEPIPVNVAPSKIPIAVEDDFSSTEDVSFEEKENEPEVAVAAPNAFKKGTRRKFTQEEGQKMLDLICEKNAFMFTKGHKLFQLMELSKHFPGRTYQSLKEHWKRTVHPNAVKNRIYNICPADLDKLIQACERTKWTKHQNVCPEYQF